MLPGLLVARGCGCASAGIDGAAKFMEAIMFWMLSGMASGSGSPASGACGSAGAGCIGNREGLGLIPPGATPRFITCRPPTLA